MSNYADRGLRFGKQTAEMQINLESKILRPKNKICLCGKSWQKKVHKTNAYRVELQSNL